MLKRIIALCAALALLAAGAVATAESYSAQTPLAGSSIAKLHNLSLAVEAVNDTTIPYGGGFSFNEVVGPRTQGRGYETAPNGRGAPVTGGGVAQAASTLYLALLNAGDSVVIDPVKTYGSRFNDRYVDNPDHAVMTDYDAGIDLSFTNRASDMTISMWMDADWVYCTLNVGGQSGATDASGWFVEEPFAPAGTVAPIRLPIASAGIDCGDEEGVLHNVQLAADSVSDTTLLSGDTFSFNEIVGPREKQYGYVSGTNGRGKRVTGGGVAQVASALWLAVKDSANFAIVEKSTYGEKYNQDYVSSSADAILTDYESGRDFSFRYLGPGSVTIYTTVTDGHLTCEIYRN